MHKMAAALRWTAFALALAFAWASPLANTTRSASISCQSAGVQCLNATALAFCIPSGDQYLGYTMDTCNGVNIWCSLSLKMCSTKASLWSLPQYDHFLCMQEGTFPDPFDCNVYHVCAAPVDNNQQDYAPSSTHLCDHGAAYNPATRLCDLDITSEEAMCGEDEYPVPACEVGVVSFGAVSLHPNYYWVCANDTVRIFKCDDSRVFDASLARCVAEEDVDPTTPGASEQCPDAGRQPDEDNCYRYIDCSDVTAPALVSCPLGMYYHQRKRLCLLGFCPY